MLINSEKMIPVTKLQRELTKRLREVAESKEALYILRNNEMAAVILSAEEYAMLKNAEEILEHVEISETVKEGLKDYNRSKNISWDKIKKKHGL